MNPIARATEWIRLGQPVLVAKKNPDWTPEMNVREFLFPSGWQNITPEECDLSTWEPGDALIAPCGWTFDVIDIDTKLGSEVTRASVPPEIEVFGEHRTPSGGYHLFVKRLGYSKNNNLTINGTHIGDYIGGTALGAGRGFSYLPGTARPKYNGQDYQVISEVDLEKLIESEPDPILVSIVMACGSSRDGSAGQLPATEGEAREFREKHREQPTCRYGRAAIEGVMAEPVTRGNRHAWYIRAMMRITELTKAGCCSMADIGSIHMRLLQVMPEGGESFEGTLRYALANTESATGCQLHRVTETGSSPYISPLVLSQKSRINGINGINEGENGDSLYRLVKASEVKIKATSWLWRDEMGGMLPKGGLTLLAGKRGIGKSLMWVWLIARITKGELPGAGMGKVGRCLIALPEDTQSEIAARIIAAGGDLDQVEFVLLANEEAEIPVDLPGLMESIRKEKPVFVVIDAINALMGGRDTYKEADVRAVLQPLQDITASTGTTLLGVVHFKKARDADLLDAINGSGAYANVPRAVWGVAVLDDGNRVVALLKASSGRIDRPGYLFSIKPVLAFDQFGNQIIEDDGVEATVGLLEMQGTTMRDGVDVCSAAMVAADGDGPEQTEQDAIVEYMKGIVQEMGGQLEAKEAAASVNKRFGQVSKNMMGKLRKRAGIVTKRHGFGTGSRFVWEYSPPIDPIDPIDPANIREEQYGDNGDWGFGSVTESDGPPCPACGESMSNPSLGGGYHVTCAPSPNGSRPAV